MKGYFDLKSSQKLERVAYGTWKSSLVTKSSLFPFDYVMTMTESNMESPLMALDKNVITKIVDFCKCIIRWRQIISKRSYF